MTSTRLALSVGGLLLAAVVMVPTTCFATVSDTYPPSIRCTVKNQVLWPPNHKLVNVGLRVQVKDNKDPKPTVTARIYADEDDEMQTGDGNHSPDATPGHTFDPTCNDLCLRSERRGDADGRVYLIVVTAKDASGNTAKHCCAVIVPHDQSKASRTSVAQQAAAAIAHCEKNGTIPPGFVPVGDGPVIGPKQ